MKNQQKYVTVKDYNKFLTKINNSDSFLKGRFQISKMSPSEIINFYFNGAIDLLILGMNLIQITGIVFFILFIPQLLGVKMLGIPLLIVYFWVFIKNYALYSPARIILINNIITVSAILFLNLNQSLKVDNISSEDLLNIPLLFTALFSSMFIIFSTLIFLSGVYLGTWKAIISKRKIPFYFLNYIEKTGYIIFGALFVLGILSILFISGGKQTEDFFQEPLRSIAVSIPVFILGANQLLDLTKKRVKTIDLYSFGKEVKSPKVGEIYWIKDTQYSHPYVIFKKEKGKYLAAAITTNQKKKTMPGVVILEKDEGNLEKPSIIEVYKIKEFDTFELTELIGKLSENRVKQIIRGIEFINKSFLKESKNI